MRFWVVEVAPYTGAWIETLPASAMALAASVAPYTGAWIETETDVLHCYECG